METDRERQAGNVCDNKPQLDTETETERQRDRDRQEMRTERDRQEKRTLTTALSGRSLGQSSPFNNLKSTKVFFLNVNGQANVRVVRLSTPQ